MSESNWCKRCEGYVWGGQSNCRCKPFEVYNLDSCADEFLTVYARGDEEDAAEKYAERDFSESGCESTSWNLKINDKVFEVIMETEPVFRASLKD